MADNDNKNIKMFHFISKFIKLKFMAVVTFAIVCLIGSFVIDLWLFLHFLTMAFYSLLLLSAFIAAKYAIKYCLLQNKKTLLMCWIFGLISLLSNSFLIYQLTNPWNTIIQKSFLFLIFLLPNLLYLIYCYKEQLRISKN